MNAIRRHLGLLASGAIVAACVWACTATRNPDGSVTVEVTPTTTITARGLEDALKQLNGLLATSSPSDRDSILKAIDYVTRRKGRILESGTGAPIGPSLNG
jgi:hypothetical protein